MNLYSNFNSMTPPTSSSQDSPRPLPARELVALLFDTSRLLCLQSDRLLSREVGLSEARARLLVAVSEAEPARMGTLARELDVTPRSITSMVDALESQNLLERTPDPDDRRATLLQLTVESRARISQLHSAQHELAEALLAPLGSQSRSDLFAMLIALRDEAASADAESTP